MIVDNVELTEEEEAICREAMRASVEEMERAGTSPGAVQAAIMHRDGVRAVRAHWRRTHGSDLPPEGRATVPPRERF